MKSENKDKFESIRKDWQKYNNPVNWEQGCEECKLPFQEDEVFTRVDMIDGETVYCFHHGKCSEQGMHKLVQGLSSPKKVKGKKNI